MTSRFAAAGLPLASERADSAAKSRYNAVNLYSIYVARNEMPANETLLHQAIREDIYPDHGYRRASRNIAQIF